MKILNRSKYLIVLSVVVVAAIAAAFVIHYAQQVVPRTPIMFVQTPDDINALAYSPDGKLLITVNSASGLVSLRDLTTGELVRQWTGDFNRDWYAQPQKLWLSKDGGRMIISSDEAGELPVCTLRDTYTGRAIRSWKSQVYQVLPDFSLMITYDSKASRVKGKPQVYYTPSVCRIVDVATGAIIGNLPEGATWRIRISMLGHYVCVPQYDRPSLLLHLPDMKSVLPLPRLEDLTMSADEKKVIGIVGGKIYCWSLPSGKEETASTGLSGVKWLFNVADGIGAQGAHVEGNSGHYVCQVRSQDGLNVRYTLDTLEVKKSNDGNEVIACENPGDGAVSFKVYDAHTGSLLCTLDPTRNSLGQIQKFDDYYTMWRFAISPDEHRCAYATTSGLLELFDIGGIFPTTISGAPSAVQGHVAVDTPPITNESNPARPTSIQQRIVEGGRQFEVHTMKLSSDGRLAAVEWDSLRPLSKGSVPQGLGEQIIDLRDVGTGHVVKTLMGSTGRGPNSDNWLGFEGRPAFSADSKHVAIAFSENEAGGRTIVWDTRTGSVAGQLAYSSGLHKNTDGSYSPDLTSVPASLAFSSDGRYIAVARDDGSIYLYSLRSFLPVAELCGPTLNNSHSVSGMLNPVQNLAFDPNGKELYGTPYGTSNALKYDVPSVSD